MPVLILARHAKAEPNGPTDFERSLSATGLAQAVEAGAEIAERWSPKVAIASAARLLKKAGAGQVLAACTHGLFIEDAANRLRGCDDILSSDTLEGIYTRYSVAPAIAAAL